MRYSDGEETSERGTAEVMRGLGERRFTSSDDHLNLKECLTKVRRKESHFDTDITHHTFLWELLVTEQTHSKKKKKSRDK